MHPLLTRLCDLPEVRRLGQGVTDRYLAEETPGQLTCLFLAGDPDKKLETADVAVVLRELLQAHPGKLRVGLVEPAAEREVMEATGTFAVPALIFFAGTRKLETIPKIQDWSVYAEALPRLLREATTEMAS